MLKALADETRWGIVRELLSGAATVSDLALRLKATQYNVSKHLRILRQSGIVQTERNGKHVHCQIVPAFEKQAGSDKKHLDLGCCVFQFDKSPSKQQP